MRYKQLLLTLLVLLGLGSALEVRADDYMQKTSNYTCYQMGINKVRFTLPTQYDGTINEGMDDGHIYLSVNGGNQETLLEWKCKKYSDLDAGYEIRAYKGGTFQLVGKAKSWKTFTKDDGWVSYDLNNDDNNKNHRTTTVDWTIPYELRGKNLKIYLWAHVNWSGAGDWHVPNAHSHALMLDWDAPSAPETSVQLSDFVLAYDQEHVGQLMSVYSFNAKSVTKATLHYTDRGTKVKKTKALEPKTLGFVYLPMDRPYEEIYVEASALDSEGNPVTISSETEKLTAPMVHVPKNFKAELTAKGTALLTWDVDDPEQEELNDADDFEVQRNLTGTTSMSDANWQSCGTVPFEGGKKTYTFDDTDLLQMYKGNKVTYRIRRLSTGIWQWAPGSGYQDYQTSTIFILPGIDWAHVVRTNEWNDNSHVVKFSYDKDTRYDSQGRFIVRNQNDWDELQTMIAKKEGSIEKSVLLLSTVNDWQFFAYLVKNGNRTLNVYMLDDINLESDQTRIDDFRGVFDGGGHRLTVNYPGVTSTYAAPFTSADGATFRNLIVDGNITTNSQFAGGLLGRIPNDKIVTIENCDIRVNLTLNKDGDGSSGGIVGIMASGSTVNIRNSAFTGQIQGAKTNSNGGFIGVALADTKINISNCLFAPTALPADTYGCATFVRADKSAKLNLNNNYFTKPYGHYIDDNKDEYFIISNSDDWYVFNNMVNSANGKKVNALLMNDIEVGVAIGIAQPYVGTFNGNGHTLTVNLISTGNNCIAPFTNVGAGTTIKNLHVKGSVTGGIHSSGLIGYSKPAGSVTSGDVHIDNVWVSATIRCYSTHAAGFVGHCNANGTTLNYKINNCLFDGAISSDTSGQYVGAFIGWGGSPNNAITNCYENGTYTKFAHAGMNYNYSNNTATAYGNNGANQNNYSSHDWGEMGGDYKNASRYGAADLANRLGSGWEVENNSPRPKFTVLTEMNADGQGTNASEMDVATLLSKLGEENWQASASLVAPIMTSTADDAYNVVIWDPRAKLQLRVNMHGESGVNQNIVDLTGNDDAVYKHQFTYELSRKCVEYSFDMIVRRASSPLGISGTDADTLVVPVQKQDVGELANYRFVNADQIDSISAVTKQSSVELTWHSTGGEHDFYRILRKDKLNQEARWDTIATNLVEQYYEDKTVLAQYTYLYRVESVFQCEGTNVSMIEAEGFCSPKGMINGYVRMADGTALSGIKVIVEPVDNVSKSLADRPSWEVYTDNTGYYEVKDLPYRTKGIYSIYAVNTGDMLPFTGGGEIEFTTSTNWIQNYNMYQDNYFIYSGNVYYRDTSIPVPGVSFKVDGALMYNASRQLITTDNQGAFELSIPGGQHRVQAVKEGHFFANDGFLINRDAPNDSTLYNFKKNVAGVYLWDSTTVVLRGRVVGGDIQGNKALGYSQSVNNLGDSLKIVMQLEGDNTSWLIRKQGDETVKTASYKVPFGRENKDTTNVNITRHTMTVRPDEKTGEYQLMVPPVKYKVIEVSAQGYATLFQQGKVGETVDLTFNVKGDTCTYNRIYHAVPDVDVKQLNSGQRRYFGIDKYLAQDILGNKDTVRVWYQDAQGIGHYSFGYPVFMAQSPCAWLLQACEKYYKNNDYNTIPDIVNLNGGKVKIQNDLTTDSKTSTYTVELDSAGMGQYVFTPDNPTFVMEDEKALKHVSITLEYDKSFYDVKPLNGKILKGFVMAVNPKQEGQYTVAAGRPLLIDILRDPPGGGSSSYIETGSKFSSSFNISFDGAVGFKLTSSETKSTTVYQGAVVAPEGSGTFSGTLTEGSSSKIFTYTVAVSYSGNWNYQYNYDVTERIQTKSGAKWIGGKADLFIGQNQNVIVYDAYAVRAIPESQYLIMKNNEGGTFQVENKEGGFDKVKVPVGTMKVLAQGTDDKGKPVYLVRDEVLSMGPQVTSTFVHSQNYIENELLPELVKLRNSLIYPNDAPYNFQELANQHGKPYYKSKLPAGDPKYGDADTYEVFWPQSYTNKVDSVDAINNEIVIWLNYLALNEKEKLSVSPSYLVKNYDFDGAANIQYSENFSAGRTDAGQIKYPIIQSYDMMSIFPSVASKIDKFTQDPEPEQAEVIKDNNGKATDLKVATPGEGFSLKWNPVLNYNLNTKNTLGETFTKKIGFTLAASSKASLNVDVYRTRRNYWDIDIPQYPSNPATEGIDLENNTKMDTILFVTSNTLLNQHDGTLYQPSYSETPVYSSFVFRTRAGVTCQPYEDARVTKWYQPGTVIDVATIPADKPRIWIEEPVKSNVPIDKPARFKLYMANETDYPDRATLIFNYFLPGDCNPKGATICVDGAPLTGTGENIVLYPVINPTTGKPNVFTKEITVYPGDDFDYEDLAISLMDPEDSKRVFTTKFSAHFIPSAGDIKVTVPGDNWVVNTESPYDSKRKAWYMPVRIEGFNVNGRGFDHIELQYKLSTQGDKDWVNVCSYYADRSLMAKASGVTDTIPNNGIIVAPFYGETDPVEQYYDLRAVVYARHAGGFLTASSPILSGIKDTRLPRLFGTPEPIDGILNIGDDIKIAFSEPIAGNYLSKINNFEVLGTPVSTDIATSTSLNFSGETIAWTMGERNLSGRDFTLDVMLNPANEERDMTVFVHGGKEKGLTFGLSADRHLTATVNGKQLVSDSIVPFNNMLRQVAYAVKQHADTITVSFFDGSKPIGKKFVKDIYKASSRLYVGADFDSLKNYTGQMLEFRLWNYGMNGEELKAYSKKSLTGYENGLMDYYKLNEGEGDFSWDKASGSMDLMLYGHSWKRPAGLSLKLDGTKGLQIDASKFSRTTLHDYTLMFWFRSDKLDGTLFSNGEAQRGQENQINIGLKDGRLYVRSAGFESRPGMFYADGNWHQFTMTVSRNRDVANVYVDKQMIDALVADSLSGIMGDKITLGATYVDKNTEKDVFDGNIDEVGMFESVLPMNLINDYMAHTPIGTMKSLMFYLNFERSLHQDDNTMYLEPTGISIKRYIDSQGKVLERRDTLIKSIDNAFVDRTYYAPMTNSSQLENLKYSYVAKDNELLIDLDQPAFTIEKTNVYITVKEVPDLQGNLMANPVTLDLYIYRNPLQWNRKKIDITTTYGFGGDFYMTVKNLSGKKQYFELGDLPIWITASQTSGTIDALDDLEICFTVSPFINVGTYKELISLNTDNGMSEPLSVTINVHGEIPEWEVSDDILKKGQSMMMVARVRIDGVIASSTEDILAVFDENDQVLGVTKIEVDNTANANEPLAYLTIHGYTNSDGTMPKLNFKFFQYSTGKVFNLIDVDNTAFVFENDAILGSASKPVIMVNKGIDVQRVHLLPDWNWISFTVKPESKTTTVKEFFGNKSKWEANDIIQQIDGTKVKQWTYREKRNPDPTSRERYFEWDNENEPFDLDTTKMYRIYSHSEKTVEFNGETTYCYIPVHRGWNRIAYLSGINLPLAQALSGYLKYASQGDIIKSQDGFAIATNSSSGLIWKGSLKYFENGKGYMLKRTANSDAEFLYPLYYSTNRYSGNVAGARAVSTTRTATTMNIVATVSGMDMEEGDRLVVYSGVDRVTEAEADSEQNYYLNIGLDKETAAPLTFCIERDGVLVATSVTGNISYQADKVLGTPGEPTDISFLSATQLPDDGKWYTTAGMQLSKRPTKAGLYIHNGKVMMIKN